MQVSEILDSELLGEGLIPTLQHAHDMLLVENAQTVPYRATTYGQVLDLAFCEVLNFLQRADLINWGSLVHFFPCSWLKASSCGSCMIYIIMKQML